MPNHMRMCPERTYAVCRLYSGPAVLLAASLLCGAATAADPEFRPDSFRAHVTFLADDLLEGRETGSRGHEIAARYVAAQFESFGLKPGGDNGTWFQSITFQRTNADGPSATVSLDGPDGSHVYAQGRETILWRNKRGTSVNLVAPLVFVGYGQENARLGLDDYAGLDVKGKIVVALNGFAKGTQSEEGAHLSSMTAVDAARHGAIGVVGIDTRDSRAATPWEVYIPYADVPRYTWVGADGQGYDPAPGIEFNVSLDPSATAALFAGSGHTYEEILDEAAREGGRPRGFPLRTTMHVQAGSRMARVTSPNVIGILPGSDPVLSHEYVILSAHLDHIGFAAEDKAHPDADRIRNGALDNASGIATMLEVARALASSPKRPRRSVIFLASTGEERGLLGADYYARHPTVPISQIVADVDLDMPLLLYSFTDVIAFGADRSTLGALVASAVAPMGVRLSPDPMPEMGIFTRSDHYMFVKQGVPSVYLLTGYANGGEQAWFDFRSNVYHTVNDDLNQPIDWNAGARFAEVNYRITRAMADADQAPRWIEGDFFGDTFAPGAPRAPRP